MNGTAALDYEQQTTTKAVYSRSFVPLIKAFNPRIPAFFAFDFLPARDYSRGAASVGLLDLFTTTASATTATAGFVFKVQSRWPNPAASS